MYAPIIVFAYNRPDHLKRTLTALTKNKEAKESDLFIFVDGPKSDTEKDKTKAVYAVAKQYERGFFKKVVIRKSNKNKGLAKSVITGVDEIINQYGKVIVTEDDAVCSPAYLAFMNGALDYYEDKVQIWSVGGYTVPIKIPKEYLSDVLATQRSSSYAWAIWKNRWEKIDWNVEDYPLFRWNFFARRNFNKWGSDRSSMLDDQMNGRVNSWAIRFDYAMYKNDMYNILPKQSLIENIGHDGSGTHSTVDTSNNDPFAVEISENCREYRFENVNTVDYIRNEYIQFFKTSKRYLIKRYIENLIYKKGKK